MDSNTRNVRRAGEVVELTGVEYDLLEILLRNAGQIVKSEDLVKEVLGRELSPFDRSIDMHVSNLRKKLGHQLEWPGKNQDHSRRRLYLRRPREKSE